MPLAHVVYVDVMTKAECQEALDAAVLAHRANPTAGTAETLRRLAQERYDFFLREQTLEFQIRTH